MTWALVSSQNSVLPRILQATLGLCMVTGYYFIYMCPRPSFPAPQVCVPHFSMSRPTD